MTWYWVISSILQFSIFVTMKMLRLPFIAAIIKIFVLFSLFSYFRLSRILQKSIWYLKEIRNIQPSWPIFQGCSLKKERDDNEKDIYSEQNYLWFTMHDLLWGGKGFIRLEFIAVRKLWWGSVYLNEYTFFLLY